MKTIVAKKKRLTVVQNQKVQTLVSIHMTQELNLNGKVAFFTYKRDYDSSGTEFYP